MRSLKLDQTYFIDFINPFPGQKMPQTFSAHTCHVLSRTTVHDDIEKTKTMFFCVKLLHYLR